MKRLPMSSRRPSTSLIVQCFSPKTNDLKLNKMENDILQLRLKWIFTLIGIIFFTTHRFPLILCAEYSNIRIDAALNNDKVHESFVQLAIRGNFSEPFELKVEPINTDIYCPEKIFPSIFRETNGIQNEVYYYPQMYSFEDKNIEPNCTYIIYAISERDTQHVAYSVPECVESHCSCRDINHMSIVVMDANPTPNSITITWAITVERVFPQHMSYNLSTTINFKGAPNDRKIRRNERLNLGRNLKTNMTWIYEFDKNITNNLEVYYRIVNERTEHCQGSIMNYHEFSNVDLWTTEAPAIKTPTTPPHSRHVTYTLAIIALLCFISVVAYICLRNYSKFKLYHHNNVIINNNHTSRFTRNNVMEENILYVDNDIIEAIKRGEADELEVQHASLKIGEEIGNGAFGRVFIAAASNINGRSGETIVAIKQLKEHATSDEFEEFKSEIKTLKRIGHHANIIRLLGCCTIKQPYLMIMEYVGFGDLLRYLRMCRDKQEMKMLAMQRTNGGTIFNGVGPASVPFEKYLQIIHSPSLSSENSDDESISNPMLPQNILRPSVTETMYTVLSEKEDYFDKIQLELNSTELHDFALQIARGMKHLEEHKIIHRDLAARNILIGNDKKLKISDFGLSRQNIYVNKKNKKVPLRWLSIEAIKENLYTSKSDVWSYGVLLWEIGTLGLVPYTSLSNQEILPYLERGSRLSRPENCTGVLYDLMLACWNTQAENRPNFTDIVVLLEKDEKLYIDFDEINYDYVFSSVVSNTNTDNKHV